MPIVQRAVTVEYSSLTRVGTPIMVPVTPYLEQGARTLDVSTGLTYPAKAERARRNPEGLPAVRRPGRRRPEGRAGGAGAGARDRA